MSQIEQDTRPLGGFVLRMLAGAVALVALPPFVLLAVLPMLLLLAPVALLAIPFMIVAFAGSASGEASAQTSARQLESRRPLARAAREATP